MAIHARRFYNDVAIQVILRMAAANGFSRVWVGHNGEPWLLRGTLMPQEHLHCLIWAAS